jgi:hypothetical protein
MRYVNGVTIETAPQARMAAALRRVTVVSLGDLRGPAEGVLELPVDVCWSLDDPRFDLGDRKQRITAYKFVLAAARRPEHLVPYLNAELLRDVWGQLGLVGRARAAWESVNPDLAPAPAVTAA